MNQGASRKLMDMLGIDHPIIQAPMAGVATPDMVAAVTEAGALGSIGLGSSDAAAARAILAAVRQRTDRPVNANVFCHRPAVADPDRERRWIDHLTPHFQRHGGAAPAQLREIYRSFLEDPDMVRALIDARPGVISFHFGLPKEDCIRALKSAGNILLGTATDSEEGRYLAARGIDAVIAQGYEAGGHRGMFDPDAADDRIGTFVLTRLLVRELPVPVIAAGGIMDGAGIAAALRLGAGAAQLGTAFVTCPESSADNGYRAAFSSEGAHHTVMTRAISGRWARSIANDFTRLAADVSLGDIPDYPIAYDIGKALHATAKKSNVHGYGAHWAGQGAALARSMPAARLVRALASEIGGT